LAHVIPVTGRVILSSDIFHPKKSFRLVFKYKRLRIKISYMIVLNPKLEIRNAKQLRISNDKNSKRLEHSNLNCDKAISKN
jgi:hypothetical protein